MTSREAGAETIRTEKSVRDIMTKEVVAVKADTSIARIAQIMDEKAISGVPVVDDSGRVIGIVTDFDLVLRNTPIEPPPFLPLLEGRIPLETHDHFNRRIRHMVGTTAREVMTEDVQTIGADEDVEAVAKLMVKRRINLVPVVEGGRLQGVVSRADIIRWMTRDHWPVKRAETEE